MPRRGCETSNRPISGDQQRTFPIPRDHRVVNCHHSSEFQVTWQLLPETQHRHYWLKGGNSNYKKIYLYMPKRFCVGQRLSRCPPGGQSSFIVDCEVSKYPHRYKLSIQDYRHDDQPAYYTFQLTPYERYSTKLIATADYRSDRLYGIECIAKRSFSLKEAKCSKRVSV